MLKVWVAIRYLSQGLSEYCRTKTIVFCLLVYPLTFLLCLKGQCWFKLITAVASYWIQTSSWMISAPLQKSAKKIHLFFLNTLSPYSELFFSTAFDVRIEMFSVFLAIMSFSCNKDPFSKEPCQCMLTHSEQGMQYQLSYSRVAGKNSAFCCADSLGHTVASATTTVGIEARLLYINIKPPFQLFTYTTHQ